MWKLVFIATILLGSVGCSSPQGVYHTVERGQTLYRIARTYDIDERDLARRNGISDPTQLRVGQRLFIPGAERPRRIAAVTSPSASSTPAPPKSKTSSKSPEKRVEAAAAPPTAKISEPPAPKRQPAAPVSGKFDWPLKGKILREFGTRGNRTCNGIEIAAGEGTPVRAAAAGRVTYSGNGIKGYGHLVIIRHDDSYFTVYGYNRKNMVETGSFVSQGEKIALSGKPPSGGEPRLHFEVRQGKDAVNPFFYLP